MLRKPIIAIFSIFTILLGSLFIFTPKSHAAGIDDVIKIFSDLNTLKQYAEGDSDPDKELKEFCNRRSGDQMNLETWYSGKCKNSDGMIKNSYMGDGVGFADIVVLDFKERFLGGPKDPDSNVIDSLIKLFQDIATSLASNDLLQKENIKKEIAQFNDQNGGFAGQLANLTTGLISNPPATSKEYIASVEKNLKSKNIITQTYAADPGFGFTSFSAVLDFWKVMRNIAYFLFAIMFVVYGFLIMFRVKIDPRTALTIELALPKIIITLILITFSYAIAGLLVDISYLAFYLIYNLLTNSIFETGSLPQTLANWASGQQGLVISNILIAMISSIFVPGAVISLVVGGPVWATTLLSFVLGFAGIGIIIQIIIAIAIIFVFFKTLWTLTVSYLSIVLKVIFSPIILLGNLLPGSNTTNSWIMGLFADMSVFPVTMLCFTISWIFMGQGLANLLGGIFGKGGTGTLITYPIIGPIFGDMSGDAALIVIGFALFLMTPKYVDIIKDALKIPPFKYGSAIGEALEFGYWGNYQLKGGPGGAKLTRKMAEWRAPKDLHGKPMQIDPNSPSTEAPSNTDGGGI